MSIEFNHSVGYFPFLVRFYFKILFQCLHLISFFIDHVLIHIFLYYYFICLEYYIIYIYIQSHFEFSPFVKHET